MIENLNPAQTCRRCGAALAADAPEGLCPRCLMALNLATETEVPGETGPHGTRVVPPPPLKPDQLAKLFPNLEILECLGRGGMGAVYKARQLRLNRLVALKILAPERDHDARFAERFQREAQALARMNHPNIVTVHDFGETEGLFYLLMEYVDGPNLRRLLKERKLRPEEALSIVPPICDALQYAHQQGIVHRDIKPENILLTKEGKVKIADFGIAKILGAERKAEPLTAEQQVIGTPHYMAPEQVEKPATVDHRADIYSLGVVFYEMLTGELPLGRFPPPSRKVQVDVRLDEIVLRALEKEPERRYQQASEVKTQVETVTNSPAQAAGTSPSPWGPRSAERSPEPGRPSGGGIGKPLGRGERDCDVRQPGLLHGLEPISARLSRLALAGAAWAPFFFIAIFLFYFGLKVDYLPGEPPRGPSWWQLALRFTVLPLGIAAPFGVTILGTIAITQIRHARGRLYGLGLAVLDALLFPLLFLDALIAACFSFFLRALVSHPWGIMRQPWIAFTWLWLTVIVLILLLDYLVARATWRLASRPLDESSPARSWPTWLSLGISVVLLLALPILALWLLRRTELVQPQAVEPMSSLAGQPDSVPSAPQPERADAILPARRVTSHPREFNMIERWMEARQFLPAKYWTGALGNNQDYEVFEQAFFGPARAAFIVTINSAGLLGTSWSWENEPDKTRRKELESTLESYQRDLAAFCNFVRSGAEPVMASSSSKSLPFPGHPDYVKAEAMFKTFLLPGEALDYALKNDDLEMARRIAPSILSRFRAYNELVSGSDLVLPQKDLDRFAKLSALLDAGDLPQAKALVKQLDEDSGVDVSSRLEALANQQSGADMMPTGVAVDAAGNVFIADYNNHCIRKQTPDGTLSLHAGNPLITQPDGTPQGGHADGTGMSARFNDPFGLATDKAGNVYVADFNNELIRKISPEGTVTTLAGQPGTAGSADGPANAATFRSPHGIALDDDGNIYVADQDNHTIRKLTPPSGRGQLVPGSATSERDRDARRSTGASAPSGPRPTELGGTTLAYQWYLGNPGSNWLVTTIAGLPGHKGSADGPGQSAFFNEPSGIAVDSARNIFVADTSNHTIRKLTPSPEGWLISTLAGQPGEKGSADGKGSEARFNMPYGVAADKEGFVYVADTYNTSIRRISPDGVVTTIAGTAGQIGHDDGYGRSAHFADPFGIALDTAGNLYVADQANHALRKLQRQGSEWLVSGGNDAGAP